MADIDVVISKICASILEIDHIESDGSPENIDSWDSFAQVAILSSLEMEFDIKFDDDELMEFFSVSDLCGRVREKLCQLLP